MRETKVVRIRDAKTEYTYEICKALDAKFAPYGVVIEQVNIMNIIIPRDLRKDLTETTKKYVPLPCQVRHQYYKLLKLKNDENKEILKL